MAMKHVSIGGGGVGDVGVAVGVAVGVGGDSAPTFISQTS